MNPPALTPGNLLINGRFLPALWSRLGETPPGTAVRCPIWAQSFAADRWHVRYSAPIGTEVTQARSDLAPDALPGACSLEIAGNDGVTAEVIVGQNLEADEAVNYRGALRFSAWLWVEHPELSSCEPALVIGNPRTTDLFDATVEEVARLAIKSVPTRRWHRVELAFDAAAFRSTGLRIELALSAALLGHPAARARLADVTLTRIHSGPINERPVAIESFLARRFFQRHDGRSINSIGRALTCNPHEMHFQFSFPEMRAYPACTLTQDNAELCVFSGDGEPQSGFAYDVTYGSRTSVVIRATKLRHQLRDGYLSFRGYRGAILLDAEL